MRRGFGLPFGTAAWTETSHFTRKRDNFFFPAARAFYAKESKRRDTATHECIELLDHVLWQRSIFGLAVCNEGV